MLKNQLFEGYQNAIDYVKAQNQVFEKLRNEIAKAEYLRDDALNQGGDKNTFQLTIDNAKNTLSNILGSTSDATRANDETLLEAAVAALQTAGETFEASVPTIIPNVELDFDNANFEPIFTVVGEDGEGEEIYDITGYTTQGSIGQMVFDKGSVTDNGDGTFANDQTTFAFGCGGEETINYDVLRVGNGTATVNMAEADIPTDNDVLRTKFDAWFGGVPNCNVDIELQNAAGERVAGFSYCLYSGTCAYNDFLSADGNGLDIASCGISTGRDEDAQLLVDKYKWQFDLIVDYKSGTVQANLLTSPTGCKLANPVALNNELSDNKIAKFVLRSNYNIAGRRSWFDNLRIYKYPFKNADDDTTGIENVNTAEKTATGAIYTLSGVQVNGALCKGIYIRNGKKILVK